MLLCCWNVSAVGVYQLIDKVCCMLYTISYVVPALCAVY